MTQTKTIKQAQAKSPARKRGRSAGRPSLDTQPLGPQALVDAGCELLRTMPPDKITRAAVARQAGVDPALINYHFKNRESLLLEVARALLDRFQVTAVNLTDTIASPRERLEARITGFLEFQMTYPFFHRLVVEEILSAQTDEAHALLGDMAARGAEGYGAILSAGLDAREMRPIDAALFYLCIVGIVEQVAIGRPILRALGHKAADDADYARTIAHFVTDLLMCGLEATPPSAAVSKASPAKVRLPGKRKAG
jgi:TetR/AcrR family transcriptional regulator